MAPSSADDEVVRVAGLIERLLVDGEFRARFRGDPAGVCVEVGLPGLAAELAGGGRAMVTMELRESRSSLAGVVMAMAAEGVAVEQLEHVLSHGLPGGLGKALRGVRVPRGVARLRAAASPAAVERRGLGKVGLSGGGLSRLRAAEAGGGGHVAGGHVAHVAHAAARLLRLLLRLLRRLRLLRLAGAAVPVAGAPAAGGPAAVGGASAGVAAPAASGGGVASAVPAGGAAAVAPVASAGAAGPVAAASVSGPGGAVPVVHAGAAARAGGSVAESVRGVVGAGRAAAAGAAAGLGCWGWVWVWWWGGVAGSGGGAGGCSGGGCSWCCRRRLGRRRRRLIRLLLRRLPRRLLWLRRRRWCRRRRVVGWLVWLRRRRRGGRGGWCGCAGSGAGGWRVAARWLRLAAGGGAPVAGVSGVLDAPGFSASAGVRAWLSGGGVDPRVVGLLESVLAHHSIGLANVEVLAAPVHVQALDIVSVDGQPVGPANFAARDLVTEIAALGPGLRPDEIGTPWPIQSPGFFSDASSAASLHLAFEASGTNTPNVANSSRRGRGPGGRRPGGAARPGPTPATPAPASAPPAPAAPRPSALARDARARACRRGIADDPSARARRRGCARPRAAPAPATPAPAPAPPTTPAPAPARPRRRRPQRPRPPPR